MDAPPGVNGPPSWCEWTPLLTPPGANGPLQGPFLVRMDPPPGVNELPSRCEWTLPAPCSGEIARCWCEQTRTRPEFRPITPTNGPLLGPPLESDFGRGVAGGAEHSVVRIYPRILCLIGGGGRGVGGGIRAGHSVPARLPLCWAHHGGVTNHIPPFTAHGPVAVPPRRTGQSKTAQ
eukprot:1194497-Prorocentrum_minimum.AAC.12